MADFVLSVVVYGPGTVPTKPSHWALAIHREYAQQGIISRVVVIEASKMVFQFESRGDVAVRSARSTGSFVMASLAQGSIKSVVRTIEDEPAPKDGVENCQDWLLRAVMSLEAEELVPPGTSDWISGLIGESSTDVARAVSTKLIATDA